MAEKVAVIGAGVMGQNHARTIVESGNSLAFVVDADEEKAMTIAQRYGNSSTVVASNIDSINENNTHAAVVASPSRFHAEHATELLGRGVHTLVEKPVAKSLEEAEQIRQAADHNDRVAMAGHIELFNPTIQALRTLLGEKAIRRMRFERLSFVSDKSRLYDNVVNDLMVHDLSIALRLVDGSYEDNLPKVIHGFGEMDSLAAPDPAEAMLVFPGGVNAHFRESRRYLGGKARRVYVETDDNILEADLLQRRVTVSESEDGMFTPEGVYVEDLRRRNYFPQSNAQPLALEQSLFLEATKNSDLVLENQVSIDNAMCIMRMTNEVLRLIENHRTNAA